MTRNCKHCGRVVISGISVVHAATGLATCAVAVQRCIPGKTTHYVFDGRFDTVAEDG